ncbi:CPBP family intramembrane metalloprotease [Photobacterium frigidiphilum]|uniref:CPBP family intramembrane metalloprotease n=1 Tax=Photobacterium frigidiphilum TaxID=264736 RepID=A0A2T3J998_9GAMM|nr:CPBP family intramembrane glutamic endopeptidase [Photobacterium frigidiphilum]PSU45358.1 CPBP family intramembrane metalloprotease [Photobacterium frigidiphilum]
MAEQLNCIIYNTLGLNKKLFLIRVYGLAVVWALALVFLNYFIFNDFVKVFSNPSDDEISAALILFLIDAPLTETLIFQCFIQAVLRHAKGSPTFSIIGSAIIFSLVHLHNSTLNAIIIIALGLALALTYEYVRMRIGNIYAFISVCIAHILWNVFAVIGIPFLFILLGLE